MKCATKKILTKHNRKTIPAQADSHKAGNLHQAGCATPSIPTPPLPRASPRHAEDSLFFSQACELGKARDIAALTLTRGGE